MTQIKKILGKQMVYDGTDEGYYNEHQIKKPGTKEIITSFNVIDAIGLEEFEMLSPNNKLYTQQIISLCNDIFLKERSFIKNSFLYLGKSPISTDTFPVYCHQKNDYITIFCSAEKNYGRYFMWLEGVFLKS